MGAKIKARIDGDGNLHLDVAGAPGQSCTELTDLITQGVGDIEEQEFTSEYCETEELPDYIKAQETPE